MPYCPLCDKKTLTKRRKEFKMYGVSLGMFPAEYCTSCDEWFFDEKTSDLIDAKARKMGLWGLAAKTRVTQSGNALAVRIAKKVAEFVSLKKGEEVSVHPEGRKRLVIEAV